MPTSDKNTGTSGKLRINYNVTQNTSSDTSSVSFSFQVVCSSSQTFSNGVGWSANAAGVANSGTFSISGVQTVTLWSSSRGPFTHDSNGNHSAQTFSMHMNGTGTSGLGGPTDHSVSVSLPRIPEAPGAPGTPTVDTVTDTAVTLDWTAAARGHANISDYGVYVATDSAFANHVYQAWVGVVLTKQVTGLTPGTTYYSRVRAQNSDGIGAYSGTRSFVTAPAAPTGLAASALTPSGFTVAWTPTPTATGYELQYSTSSSFSGATSIDPAVSPEALAGLNPGTPYYVRVRAKNASGFGAWSATLSATTLPATAPGITVTPGVTGTTASIGLTPPSGATGVTKYTVERRLNGTTTPVTSTDTTTSPLAVTGLTPGNTYQWRATAWFGTYQSPASAWVTAVQPKPNTSPGDYFDGATADIADPNAGEPPLINYGWTSTANASTSTAVAPSVDGWIVGAAGGGGTSVLQRVLGGRSGQYAARMLMTRGASGASMYVGMSSAAGKRSEVEPDTPYVGSIYVRPSRTQRLAANIRWHNAAGAEVGQLVAEAVTVEPGAWTRLVVPATSPSDAASAVVWARDMTGTDWTPWQAGEYLDADDVMVTLAPLRDWFYGDSPDTATAVHDWLGPVNASVSTMTPIENTAFDPLADPDCDPLPLPPTPPIVLDDCIIEVGTWRRYWVVVPATEVNLWLATIPTIHLHSGRGQDNLELPPEGVRQVRIRLWENPDALDPSVFNGTEWEAEQIVSYMPPFTILTLDGVNERAWAQVGSETVDPATVTPIAADRLLYGTNGAPATWPVLACGIGYLISLDVPLDAPVGNLTADLDLTKRML